MTNSDANAVADKTVKAKAHQYVPDISQVLVQSYDYSTYGVVLRQPTDILHGERISSKCSVFSVDSDRRKIITRQKVKIECKEYDARMSGCNKERWNVWRKGLRSPGDRVKGHRARGTRL
jgi:hypothetical protein